MNALVVVLASRGPSPDVAAFTELGIATHVNVEREGDASCAAAHIESSQDFAGFKATAQTWAARRGWDITIAPIHVWPRRK